jgi:hypothetical protein
MGESLHRKFKRLARVNARCISLMRVLLAFQPHFLAEYNITACQLALAHPF